MFLVLFSFVVGDVVQILVVVVVEIPYFFLVTFDHMIFAVAWDVAAVELLDVVAFAYFVVVCVLGCVLGHVSRCRRGHQVLPAKRKPNSAAAYERIIGYDKGYNQGHSYGRSGGYNRRCDRQPMLVLYWALGHAAGSG